MGLLQRLFGRFIKSRALQAPTSETPAPVVLYVVVPGERRDDDSLALQGSIQAGLVGEELKSCELSAIQTTSTRACRQTATKIASFAEDCELTDIEQADRDYLVNVIREYAGSSVAVVLDISEFDRLMSAIEDRLPGETGAGTPAPASISRIEIFEDLSYRMRFSDTTHLEVIVGNRIGGLRLP